MKPLSQAAYKRQADERDDVVGTQWPSASEGGAEGAPSKEAARERMRARAQQRERAHSSKSEGARVGHFAGSMTFTCFTGTKVHMLTPLPQELPLPLPVHEALSY